MTTKSNKCLSSAGYSDPEGERSIVITDERLRLSVHAHISETTYELQFSSHVACGSGSIGPPLAAL